MKSRIQDSRRTKRGVGSMRLRDESGPTETRTWFALRSGTVSRTWSSKGGRLPVDEDADGVWEDEEGEVAVGSPRAVET